MKLYEVRITPENSIWFATLSRAKECTQCYIGGRADSADEKHPWPELLAHDVIRETKATKLMCVLLNGKVDDLITSTTVLFRHEPRTKTVAAEATE